MPWQPVTHRWLASPGGDLLAGVNWFDKDIFSGEPNRTIMLSLAFALSAVSRVDIIITVNGITKTIQLLDGATIGADDFFAQRVLLAPGASFNLTHEIGTLNPAVFIHKEVDE